MLPLHLQAQLLRLAEWRLAMVDGTETIFLLAIK